MLTVTSADGSFYEGEFDKGKFNGNGLFIYSDGRRYEGEWAEGKPHNKGVYS